MALRVLRLLLLALGFARPGEAEGFGFVLEAQWAERSGAVQGLLFAPDGSSVVALVGHRAIPYTLGKDGPPVPRDPLEAPAPILAAALSPRGEALAWVDREGTLGLYDLVSQRPIATIEKAHKGRASAVTFTSDGSYVVSGGEDGRLRVWTPRGQSFAELIQGGRHKGAITFLAALPGERRVLSVGRDRQVLLWDLDTQRLLRPTRVEFDVLSAGFGGDGKTLVLGLQALTGNRGVTLSDAGLAHSIRADDRVRLVDAESGLHVRDLFGEEQDLNAVAVSPDGRFVAAGGSRAFASVWDAATGDRITSIPLAEPATALAFAPDGRWLVAGSKKGSLALLKLSGVGPGRRPPGRSEILILVLAPSGVSDQRGGPVPRIPTPSVRVQGKIKSEAPLKSLVVAGREITSLTPDEAGDLRFNAWVPLPAPGAQEIEIVAESVEGTLARRTFRVERTVEPAPAAAGPRSGSRRALIVGISDYRNDTIDLQYADRDAKALYDTLTNPALGPAAFDRRDVRLLLNREATVANINTGLREFLRQAREEDSVLFFFAGHGAPDPNQLTDLYLLAHDTSPDNIAGTGLLMRHVRESLAEIPARHVLILTDSCHSGGIASSPGLRALTVNPIHQVFLERLRHASGGLAILTASEAAQVSYENSRWEGHGVFTHFLVKGLRGDADSDHDGIVALGELLEFVRERVKAETGSKQIPAIGATSFDRDLPLAIRTTPKPPA